MKVRLILFIFIASTLSIFAQENKPVSPSKNNPKAIALLKEALKFENEQEFEKAIKKYQEVLKIAPNDFAAMNSIAGIYGILQQPQNEILWAKKSVQTKPNFMHGYINLGNGYAMQGDFENASKSYKKAEEISPKDPLPIYSLGVISENIGFENKDGKKLREALTYYLKSLELDQKFENGLFSAAAMYANLKEFDKASVLLKKLIIINPNDIDAQQMLKKIEFELSRQKP